MLPRLAAYAAYEGEAGPWELWLSCAGKTAAKAVASLDEEQAFWFAAWCFANRREALGALYFFACPAKCRGFSSVAQWT